jgi:hypothetical protein
VGKYRHKKHIIKVRCSCQYLFEVLLDFRRNYRKETDLVGTFVMVPPAAGTGRLNIINLSKSGIGFTVAIPVNSSRLFVPGRKLHVNFQLDNKKRTSIEKIAIVRNAHDHYVGCEFDHTQAFEKDLGFYLQP